METIELQRVSRVSKQGAGVVGLVEWDASAESVSPAP